MDYKNKNIVLISVVIVLLILIVSLIIYLPSEDANSGSELPNELDISDDNTYTVEYNMVRNNSISDTTSIKIEITGNYYIDSDTNKSKFEGQKIVKRRGDIIENSTIEYYIDYNSKSKLNINEDRYHPFITHHIEPTTDTISTEKINNKIVQSSSINNISGFNFKDHLINSEQLISESLEITNNGSRADTLMYNWTGSKSSGYAEYRIKETAFSFSNINDVKTNGTFISSENQYNIILSNDETIQLGPENPVNIDNLGNSTMEIRSQDEDNNGFLVYNRGEIVIFPRLK